jgi:hypothetical protein
MGIFGRQGDTYAVVGRPSNLVYNCCSIFKDRYATWTLTKLAPHDQSQLCYGVYKKLSPTWTVSYCHLGLDKTNIHIRTPIATTPFCIKIYVRYVDLNTYKNIGLQTLIPDYVGHLFVWKTTASYEQWSMNLFTKSTYISTIFVKDRHLKLILTL